MKNRLLLFLAAAAAAGILWSTIGIANTHTLTLRFTSNPFPLAVGPTTLYFTLDNEGGLPIDDATLQLSNYIEEGGEVTLTSQIIEIANGQFTVPVVYPRMGQWTIDVRVELPNAQESIRESYLVYVYGVSPHSGDGTSLYRSASQIENMLAANPEKEYWIIIPQGAREIAMHSFADDEVIPSEIRLQVSRRNTLIIQNDDTADHTVGPFFVRAGETVRQEFSQPAEYQGACSLRHSNEIRIIVDA